MTSWAVDDHVSVWTPLDASRSQIRLLRLEPNTNLKAWPVGQLEVRSLEDCMRYEAISYAWGGPQSVHPLFVNGLEMPITENLCGALRYLRYPHQARYLWIDAICISQRNLEERAQQVALMRRIFREASNVCIWLGHGSEPVENVLHKLKYFGDELEGLVPVIDPPDDHWSDDNDKEYTSYEGLEKLAKVDFWNRLWVIQEVTVARSLSVHYGQAVLGSSTLNQEALDELSFDMMGKPDVTKEARELLGELLTFNDILSKTSALPLLEKLRVVLAFFTRARTPIVSDPRDRVYGLLGIYAWYFGSDLIDANYALDTIVVYTTFARRDIQKTKSLLVLSQATPYHNALAGLPSWVPDWSSSYDHKLHSYLLARWKAY